MRLLSRKQSLSLDEQAVALFPPGELLEKAGRALWDFVQALRPQKTPILILAGLGNNGGDGWILARLAASEGWPVEVVEWFGAPRSGLVREKKAGALAAGARIVVEASFAQALRKPLGLVVDAIVGTGMDRVWDESQSQRLQWDSPSLDFSSRKDPLWSDVCGSRVYRIRKK
jgi:NAD(P)H-hydrate epimerase